MVEKHARTLQEISALTQEHTIHTFPHTKNASRGGFFRIQITAKSAVFQILFLTGNGLYIPAYEGDLKKLANGSAFEAPPFSLLPPLLQIPRYHGSKEYRPATYENLTELLASMPHNAPTKQLYRSYTEQVFARATDMAEDLLAA